MPSSQSRVVGSGFSVLRWQGQRILYLDSVTDSGQSPVAPVQGIQPLDEEYPIEFAVPRAMGAGSLSLSIRETWNKPVWQHLKGFETANNLLDVWKAMAAMKGTITCQTIIKPPQGSYWRLKTYHNVVISNIEDQDSIAIASMTVTREIACFYTHATRSVVAAGTA